MFCGLANFPWLSIYQHGGRRWWLDFYFGCISPLNPPLMVQRTCTSPPPGPETSWSAGGRGSPAPGGRSAGPAPLSPPPGPPSAPAKNRKWQRKRKRFKKRYDSLTARVNINTLCATVGHVRFTTTSFWYSKVNTCFYWPLSWSLVAQHHTERLQLCAPVRVLHLSDSTVTPN